MKKQLLLITFIILHIFLFSQTIIMDVEVEDQTIKPKWGKNLSHFIHSHFGYGMVVDNFKGNGANIKNIASKEIFFGLMYKKRITNYYANGLNLTWSFNTYHIKQNSNKSFPSNINYSKEKFNYNSLSFEYYNRVNFDRRGNYIGKFIDVGVYGFVCTRASYVNILSQDTLNINFSKKVKTKSFMPDYLENIGYGFNARLGWNNYVLYCKYRYSNLIKPKQEYDNYPEFPRLTVGLQIGIH